jgi:hypothetical protein
LEIGDAVSAAGGYAVGIVHRTAAGRSAAIEVLDPAGSLADVLDLGVTPGDAPPARVVPWGAGMLAAAYGLRRDASRGDAEREERELGLFSVFEGVATPYRRPIAQPLDDSFAFDLAAGATTAVAVWDEATPKGKGVIRAAEVTPGVPPEAPRAVSPPESDAETPRILALRGGYLSLWLVRQAEGAAGRDGGTPGPSPRAAEAPSEDRSLGWVEAVALDAHGAVAGPVRHLTPSPAPAGSAASAGTHISAFDAEVLADGSILVVARDDGEAVDGSGGVLLRVRAIQDRIEPPLAWATDGLGRGSPALVAGAALWLSWVGPDERLRLMPLDSAGLPVGPPSVEESLGDARPLLTLGESAGSARLLVASTGGSASKLRGASCER